MNATRTCVRPSDTLHLCRRGLHLNANRPLAMAATASTPAQLVLKVKKLSEHAILPVRGSLQAAGYDLARYGGSWPGLRLRYLIRLPAHSCTARTMASFLRGARPCLRLTLHASSQMAATGALVSDSRDAAGPLYM